MKHIFGRVSPNYSSSNHRRSSCWFSSASLANPARMLSCLLKRKKAWNQLYKLANEGIVKQWLPTHLSRAMGSKPLGVGIAGESAGEAGPLRRNVIVIITILIVAINVVIITILIVAINVVITIFMILITIIIITCADSNQRRSTWGWRRDLWA